MSDPQIKSASPYLMFDGRCEEAIDFYKATVGAKVEAMMRFSDAPTGAGSPDMPEAMKSKIMHASMRIGDTEIMLSDGMCTGKNQPHFDGFTLTLTVPDVATAEALFDNLSAGGSVRQPLIETFFAARFGVLADKFGLGWMVLADRKTVEPGA